MTPFGGLEPAAIHALIGNGYGTWVDTDAGDQRVLRAHSATVIDRPADEVFAAVSDFTALQRKISLLSKIEVRPLDGERFETRFEAKVGLALFSITVPLAFRMRTEGRAVHCEDYLGGAFEQAHFALRCDPLGPDRTLFTLAFHGDVRSLGLVARFFLRGAPELEVAISGNMVVVPLMAMAALAGRSELPPSGGAAGARLEDQLTELGPALDQGILTVGRLDGAGEITEVCCAARLAVSRERLWTVVRDPAQLVRLVSFIDSGSAVQRGPQRELSLSYKARFGPLRKRYKLALRVTEQPPGRFESVSATTDGEPANYADVLVEDGESTLYAHRFSTDLKRDWLSRKFLGQHPELERLIAQYAPMMQVIALRRHFGKPPARGS